MPLTDTSMWGPADWLAAMLIMGLIGRVVFELGWLLLCWAFAQIAWLFSHAFTLGKGPARKWEDDNGAV